MYFHYIPMAKEVYSTTFISPTKYPQVKLSPIAQNSTLLTPWFWSLDLSQF